MGSEGQDFSLAKDEVLKEIFPHLSFKTLPEGRDEVFSVRLGLAGHHRHGRVDLKDRKSGKLQQEAAEASWRGREPGGKGGSGFGEPHRKDLGKQNRLTPGKTAQTVKDTTKSHVKRLKESDPGNLGFGQRRGTGKGDKGTSPKGRGGKGVRHSVMVVGEEEERKPVLHIQGRMRKGISLRMTGLFRQKNQPDVW